MKNQDKKYEIDFFNQLASSGHYETVSKELYNFLLSILSKNNIAINGSVLEAGCGEGVIGKTILKKFPDTFITGVDISENMVKIANNNTKNYSAMIGDIENKELFVTNQFDFIICPFILHHFMGLDGVFGNFSNWIKKEGYILVIEPNGSNPVNKISKMIRKTVELLFNKNYIIDHKLATPNETDHTIKKYKALLNKYNFEILNTYSNFSVDKYQSSDSLIGKIKNILYNFYKLIMPNHLSSGNDVIIIAKSIKII